MRRANREIKELAEIESVLNSALVCRLAMVDDGMPYIVPLNYGYKDGVIYFHCAKEGRKIDILTKNNQVCFEVDTDLVVVPGARACDYTAHYKSVVGMGKVHFLSDPSEIKNGLDVLMRHYVKDGPSHFEYSETELGHVFLGKVVIEEMTGKKLGD